MATRNAARAAYNNLRKSNPGSTYPPFWLMVALGVATNGVLFLGIVAVLTVVYRRITR